MNCDSVPNHNESTSPIAGTIESLRAMSQIDRGVDPDSENVQLVVIYGKCRHRSANAETLAAGDIIRLDQPVSAPVQILLDGAPFAEGALIRNNHRWGVTITRLITRQTSKYAA